jgi:hypothetical protein
MADADDLRERLRGLSRASQPALGSELQERVVSRLRTEGPRIVRRSRRRRMLLASSVAALPFAILAGWVGLQRAANSGTHALSEPLPSAKPAQCAALPAPEPRGVALPAGRQFWDLGARGRIALEAGSVAQLVSSDPCKLELRLAQGRLSVHAQNLFGGELRVRAGATDVVVHGTRFAVERAADGVTVDVDEGAVAVERAGRASGALLRGGQRLRWLDAQAPVLLALADVQRLQLRAALAAEPVAQVQGPRVIEQPRRESPHSSVAPPEARSPQAVGQPRRSSAPPPTAAPARSAQAIEEPSTRELAAHPEAVSVPQDPAPVAQVAQPSAARTPSPVRHEQVSQPSAARAPSAAELVARADTLWLSGARDAARDRYRQAGVASRDPTAEAAWLALARRELSIGRAAAAREALAGYAAHFPEGELRDEAAGIAFRVALAADDVVSAERLARGLVAHHSGTPPARAAARWLSEHGFSP